MMMFLLSVSDQSGDEAVWEDGGGGTSVQRSQSAVPGRPGGAAAAPAEGDGDDGEKFCRIMNLSYHSATFTKSHFCLI